MVHCNLVTNDYQQASKVLFTFVPDKSFGQLMNINPHSPTMLKTVNAEFPFIKVWFTDQDNKPLEIEDNVNITLIVGINKLEMGHSLEPKHRRYVKRYDFLSFANKYGKKMMNAGMKAGKKIAESKNTRDFAKTAGKKILGKTSEATGDLVGSKIADKITSMKKTSKWS